MSAFLGLVLTNGKEVGTSMSNQHTLTCYTTVQFNSHHDAPGVPRLWFYSDRVCCQWRLQMVHHHCGTVCITRKNLKCKQVKHQTDCRRRLGEVTVLRWYANCSGGFDFNFVLFVCFYQRTSTGSDSEENFMW